MSFTEVLEQVREELHTKGRLTYRAIKRMFDLDAEYVEDIKEELIDGEQVATDEDNKVLVWIGNGTQAESTPIEQNGQTPTPVPKAERRQLTVMFCDLVGSTALSEQLDPEELRALVQQYQETCASVLERFQGYIAQYLGDGLLIYFGYPTAHEDAAARAVRAGLGILSAMQALNQRITETLQVRIGIHTGIVVVGEIGVGKKEQLALGEAPNIAARVQGLAKPDTVVISAKTEKLVHGQFAVADLGAHEVKGISDPIAVYHVLKETYARSRFEAIRDIERMPLVGREHESGILQERLASAKDGDGQVVLVSGEPGVGKSRLVQEIVQQASTDGVVVIPFQGAADATNTAFSPVIAHLQRLLRFAQEETVEEKLEKLQRRLSRYCFPKQYPLAFPLLSSLLSLSGEQEELSQVSPQAQKQQTQQLLCSWLLEEAEERTVCCVWEDLHWVDPSSLDLLALLVEQTPTARLCLVLTYRLEYTPPWPIRSHMSHLVLSRLGRKHVEAIVEEVAAGRALPEAVVEEIAQKTDGVPLFVEELTKVVVESGEISSIPPTLHDSLMARLDRLGQDAREIAQVGATIGRQFSGDLLQTVSPFDAETLNAGLTKLVNAELVYQRRTSHTARYVFKHALVQDTAYQSLLKSERQAYHARIGEALEMRKEGTPQPEVLAHHFTEAGHREKAMSYWQQAGDGATQQSAFVEAIHHFTKALTLLESLPETPERDEQELALLVAQGVPLISTKGYGVPEVEALYSRARTLCQKIGETPQLIPVLHGLRVFYLIRSQLPTALELAQQILQLAEQTEDQALLQVAHGVVAETAFYLADGEEAKQHLDEGTHLYVPEQHQANGFLWLDTGVACLVYAALERWWRGYADQAVKKCEDGVQLARELTHVNSLAFALSFAAWLHAFRRDVPACQAAADEAIALATEHGLSNWLYFATILRGWALTMEKQSTDGIQQMQEGLHGWQAIGAELMQPFFLTLMAEGLSAIGEAEAGLESVNTALSLVNDNQERLVEAELTRWKGELLLQADNDSASAVEAEACFAQALRVSKIQDAKAFSLRAAISLARLWQQQGKEEEAHTLLTEVYEQFTEGFDTVDLKDADTLLQQHSEPLAVAAG